MSEQIDLLLKLHIEGWISDEALDKALRVINKPREEAPIEGVKDQEKWSRQPQLK